MKTLKKSDGRRLGWWTVGLLSVMLSSSAWALDLDHEIQAREDAAAQVLSTLGRDKQVNQQTSEDTDAKVQVQMIRAPKARKRG